MADYTASPGDASQRFGGAYAADTYAKLVSLKGTYDPRNPSHLNQNIAPTSARAEVD